MPNTLFLLQFGSLIFTVVMALTLSIAGMHIVRRYRPYEKSRWILVSALSLLSVHYLLQMIFNLRASGDDVGAVINILFYAPAAFLVSYAVLNLECSRETLRTHLKVGLSGYGLILAVCCIGCAASGSLHIGLSLYAMDALFLICMLYFIFIPIREIRKTYKEVESCTGGDMSSYHSYVKTSFYLLCLSALIAPFSIISTTSLCVIGPLQLLILLSFVVNFIVLGYNSSMLQTIQESQCEPQTEVTAKSTEKEQLSSERVAAIQTMLDKWVESKGFLETELSLSSLSTSLGVRRRDLSIYFEFHQQMTFRVWLSNIRFSAAKKLLLEHPEYSNDAISAACGFSSRAQLYNIFRNNVGMTPKEYLASHHRDDGGDDDDDGDKS